MAFRSASPFGKAAVTARLTTSWPKAGRRELAHALRRLR